MFFFLADPYADMILADGITILCNDLQVTLSDCCLILLLAFLKHRILQFVAYVMYKLAQCLKSCAMNSQVGEEHVLRDQESSKAQRRYRKP